MRKPIAQIVKGVVDSMGPEPWKREPMKPKSKTSEQIAKDLIDSMRNVPLLQRTTEGMQNAAGLWKLGPYNLTVEHEGPIQKGWGWLFPDGDLHRDEHEAPQLWDTFRDASSLLGKSEWADVEGMRVVYVRGYEGENRLLRRTYVIELWRTPDETPA